MKEWKEAFQQFDVNGDGQISRSELSTMMKKLGQDVTDQELDAILSAADTNKDGTINLQEFIAIMTKWSTQSMDDQIREAFKMFDKDDSGTISADELRKGLKQVLGETLPEDEIDALIREVDLDGSGDIDYEEFFKTFKASSKS